MADDIQHERELREQWQRSHEQVHSLEKENLILAHKENERRLEEHNKFREQQEKERGLFVRRDMYDEQHYALRKEMDDRLKALETNRSNLEGRMWAMGAGIGAIVVGLNLLLRYIK